MTQLDPTLGPSALPKPQASPAAAAPSATPGAGQGGFSFHDLLSIINPLQHIPVISTIYRAITGDKIGVPEKIAGDALYGGLWGAVSGVADAAFEAVTGKDFGDTVLAFFTGNHDAATQVAGAAPSTASITAQAAASLNAAMPAINAAGASSSAGLGQLPANPPSQSSNPDFLALAASLSQKGVDSTLAQRALFAYQKSMALPASMLAPAQ